jgi:hypothetical protein
VFGLRGRYAICVAHASSRPGDDAGSDTSADGHAHSGADP